MKFPEAFENLGMVESFKKLAALRRNTFPLARQVTVKRVFGGHGSGRGRSLSGGFLRGFHV